MILLSFDIEEFDMPLEYGGKISLPEQLKISRKGTIWILDTLRHHNIRATFFSTVVFAEANTDLIQRIVQEGHELASHTWYHSDFKEDHLLQSRERLKEISGQNITGLRMPRMSPVSEMAVLNAGYHYNSSINPTWIPGRYNNLNISRLHFVQNDVIQIPASVTPRMRIPLFWLSFHNFPIHFYQKLLSTTYRQDGYANIYFHPWEFMDLDSLEWKLPFYARRNTGIKMQKRFSKLLEFLQFEGVPFSTLGEFADSI